MKSIYNGINKCVHCDREFKAKKEFKRRKQKYCSLECYRKEWVLSIRPKIKVHEGLSGSLNPSWKGDKVGYYGIHAWLYRERGKPRKCEHCGSEKKKKYEWCNVDHKYKRDMKDWMRLCTSCHRKYDYENIY